MLYIIKNARVFVSLSLCSNCDQFEEIKKCYHPFTRQLEVCFTGRDVSMIKTLILLEEEFAFICEKDGANVVTVHQSNYSYCAGNLKDLLHNCTTSGWAELRSKTIETMTKGDCRYVRFIRFTYL